MTATRSPKFRRLMKYACLSKREAVGTLELLWLFTMENAPAGDVGKWSDSDIELECEWTDKEGALIVALVESGWLDRCSVHRLVIHDWNDHLPEFLRLRVHRKTLKIVSPTPIESTTSSPPGDIVRRPYDYSTTDVEREEKGREAKRREDNLQFQSEPPPHGALMGDSDSGDPVFDWTEPEHAEHAEHAEPKSELVLVAPGIDDIESEVFDSVCRVAGEYHENREPRSWKITKQRRARMRAIAKEFGPTAPADAFHGFVSYHVAGQRWPDQRANLNPETVWRPSNVAKYIDVFSESGCEPIDIHAPKKPSWMIQTERIAKAEGLLS